MLSRPGAPALCLLGLAVLVCPLTASAAGQGPVEVRGDNNGGAVETGVQTAGERQSGADMAGPVPARSSRSGASGGDAGEATCRYTSAGADFAGVPGPGGQMGGAWFLNECAGFGNFALSWLPTAGGGAGAGLPVVRPDPAVLARQARDRMQLPLPVVALNPSPRSLVNLATFLWLEPGSQGVRTVTTSVPGLSVTVTARSQRLTWEPGDGSPAVSCATAPPVGGAAVPAPAGACAHVYRSASVAGGTWGRAGEPAFAASVSVPWAVTWRATDGQAGDLPPLVRTAPFALPVEEVQTVVTASG